MRRFRFVLLGLVPALPLLAASCSHTPVSLGLVMKAPQSIQDAESVDLYVYDATDHTCAQDGQVDAIPEAAAVYPLSKDGCADGLVWCADIQLTKTDTPQMFAVLAKSQGQSTLQGCTSAPIDQDPLVITIEMQQIIEPACCGDGKVQVGEECDPGGSDSCGGVTEDEVCTAACLAQEQLLSVKDTQKPFLANDPHTKSDLAMAFCPGNAEIGTALRTVFTSTDLKATNKSDIDLRVMSPDLRTITQPLPLSQQLRLPIACTNPYGAGGKGADVTAAITAVAQNSTLVVYASNEKSATSSDVFLVEHSEDVCADTPVGVDPAVAVSQQSPPPGAITPDIARGPAGTALIVWKQAQKIVGRTWKAGKFTPPTDAEPTPIADGSAPRVAGSAKGWIVVYEGSGKGDGDGVFKRAVSIDGVPGDEVLVNGVTDGAQVHPGVAVLESGAYAVVWQSGPDIFFQRFGLDGSAVKGDQDAPLNNDIQGAHAAPAIAAPQSGSGFFTAAWENEDGSISARFMGATNGFLFNPLDGQNTSFLASHPDLTSLRHKPAIAIGDFVIFGWQDDSDTHPGIYARRFPLPK